MSNSKTIYYYYVYQITNIVSGKFYIGKRTAKIEPHLDLGIKYFSTSSDKDFMLDQKQHPEKFKYDVLSIWNTALEMNAEEIRLHELYNMCKRNPLSYNIKKAGVKFDVSGKAAYRNIETSETCSVSIGDPRIGTILVHVTKGKATYKNIETNENETVSTNDPRIGIILFGIHKGKAIYKNIETSENETVSTNDPRIGTIFVCIF